MAAVTAAAAEHDPVRRRRGRGRVGAGIRPLNSN